MERLCALGALALASVLQPAAAAGLVLANQTVHWWHCSDKCLDVAHGAQFNGNNIQIWDCVAGLQDQRFDVPVEVPGQIKWANHPDKCIQVGGDLFQIMLWDCQDGNDYQMFEMSDAGQIQWVQDRTKCFDVHKGLTANGNHVNLWDCGKANSLSQSFVPAQQGAALPVTGCPAALLDEVASSEPPMITVHECSDKCNAVPEPLCECGVFRVTDGRCLLQHECPNLPETFWVDGMEHKVIKRGELDAASKETTTTAAPMSTLPETTTSLASFTFTITLANVDFAQLEDEDLNGLEAKVTEAVSEMLGMPSCKVGAALLSGEGRSLTSLVTISAHSGDINSAQQSIRADATALSDAVLAKVRSISSLPTTGEVTAEYSEASPKQEQAAAKASVTVGPPPTTTGTSRTTSTFTGTTSSRTTTTFTTSTTVTTTMFTPLLMTTYLPAGSNKATARPWFFMGLPPPDLGPDADPGKPGPLPVRLRPSLEAHPVGYGDELAAGTVFQAEDMVTSPDGVRFMKLGDSRWVPERFEAGGAAICIPLQAQKWRHIPSNSKPSKLLSSPIHGAFATGAILQPDEVFTAVIQMRDTQGSLWLKLEQNTGWIYERNPVTGDTVCERVPVPLWEYNPEKGATFLQARRRLRTYEDSEHDHPESAFKLLSRPELEAPPLDPPVTLVRGQIFAAEKQEVGDGITDFLRPEGEKGWIPVRSHMGTICKPIKAAEWLFDAGRPGAKLPIFSGPSGDAFERGSLATGEVFRVAEEKVSDGQNFLRLADGRGWVAEAAEGGAVCSHWPPKEPAPLLSVPMIVLLAILVCLVVALFWLRGQGKPSERVRTAKPLRKLQSSGADEARPLVMEAAMEEAVEDKTPQIPKVPFLALTFKEDGDDTTEYEFFFTEKPLGFTFPLESPLKVDGFTDDGNAFQKGMRLGMTLSHMGNRYPREVLKSKYYVGDAEYETLWGALRDAVARLPLEKGAVDYAGKVEARPASPRSGTPRRSKSPRGTSSASNTANSGASVGKKGSLESKGPGPAEAKKAEAKKKMTQELTSDTLRSGTSSLTPTPNVTPMSASLRAASKEDIAPGITPPAGSSRAASKEDASAAADGALERPRPGLLDSPSTLTSRPDASPLTSPYPRPPGGGGHLPASRRGHPHPAGGPGDRP